MSTSDLLPPEVYQEFARQIPVAKYGLVAVCTMLLYDNLLSLDDEIEYMWNQRFTFVTLLFLLNRHYALVVFIISLLMAISPAFTPSVTVNTLCKVFTTRIQILKQIVRCQSFILLEAIGTGTILTILPDMVIGMRVYALYKRSRILGAFLTIYLTAEFGVALWIYLTPKVSPVILPGPESITNSLALHACLGAPSSKLSNLQVASFQFMQTAYDTVVLLLIIAKTIKETLGQRLNSLHGIQSLIVQHGVIYYVVVFTTNFTWAMMILFATENFKYSMAS
ncbi:hypothetical protein SCHPADRAFT_940560 [Schizopora paradoxa]|uniref:DUF6533 domain-containing protein n=1 Tax=Schizopora paradoxa TaxID=27342 RepID=A0A0H2RNJ9_9AGAM|nr:hypothetical protein SCHPADRAFT_940560 [Schizopora paradoxa]